MIEVNRIVYLEKKKKRKKEEEKQGYRLTNDISFS